MDHGTTIGIYIGQDDGSLIEDYDTAHNPGTRTYSRSKAIKEDMRLGIAIQDTLDTIGYDLEGHMLRSFVRQAMLEQARREEAEE